MQNILPVLCFIAGFALAWLIWHGRSAARAADLQARLETERKSTNEKLALLEDTRQKVSDAFKALSADALARNSQSFLELAGTALAKTQEAARGDLELRQQAIADMVTPVRESLDQVDHKIQELEKARAGAYAGLSEQVRSLIETQ
jgi:DNA recombination protein RmuC